MARLSEAFAQASAEERHAFAALFPALCTTDSEVHALTCSLQNLAARRDPFAELPRDILERVAAHLEPRDLAAALCVSQQWHAVLTDVRKPWDIYTARLQLVPPTEDHPVLRGRAGFFAARHDARRLVPGPYPSEHVYSTGTGTTRSGGVVSCSNEWLVHVCHPHVKCFNLSTHEEHSLEAVDADCLGASPIPGRLHFDVEAIVATAEGVVLGTVDGRIAALSYTGVHKWTVQIDAIREAWEDDVLAQVEMCGVSVCVRPGPDAVAVVLFALCVTASETHLVELDQRGREQHRLTYPASPGAPATLSTVADGRYLLWAQGMQILLLDTQLPLSAAAIVDTLLTGPVFFSVPVLLPHAVAMHDDTYAGAWKTMARSASDGDAETPPIIFGLVTPNLRRVLLAWRSTTGKLEWHIR